MSSMVSSLNKSYDYYRSTPTQHQSTQERTHYLISLMYITIEIIRIANMPLNCISL